MPNHAPKVDVQCSEPECAQAAVWRPVLVLRATTGTCHSATLPLALCSAHRGGRRLKDVLSLAGVDVVEGVLLEFGLTIADVDWDRSNVRFVEIQ